MRRRYGISSVSYTHRDVYKRQPLERPAVYEALEKAVGMIEEEQERQEQSKDGFTAAVENILTEYLRSPSEKTRLQLQSHLLSEQGQRGFYELALFQMRRLEQTALSREEMRERLKKAAAGKAIYLCLLDRFTSVSYTHLMYAASSRVTGTVFTKPAKKKTP